MRWPGHRPIVTAIFVGFLLSDGVIFVLKHQLDPTLHTGTHIFVSGPRWKFWVDVLNHNDFTIQAGRLILQHYSTRTCADGTYAFSTPCGRIDPRTLRYLLRLVNRSARDH